MDGVTTQLQQGQHWLLSTFLAMCPDFQRASCVCSLETAQWTSAVAQAPTFHHPTGCRHRWRTPDISAARSVTPRVTVSSVRLSHVGLPNGWSWFTTASINVQASVRANLSVRELPCDFVKRWVVGSSRILAIAALEEHGTCIVERGCPIWWHWSARRFALPSLAVTSLLRVDGTTSHMGVGGSPGECSSLAERPRDPSTSNLAHNRRSRTEVCWMCG